MMNKTQARADKRSLRWKRATAFSSFQGKSSSGRKNGQIFMLTPGQFTTAILLSAGGERAITRARPSGRRRAALLSAAGVRAIPRARPSGRHLAAGLLSAAGERAITR